MRLRIIVVAMMKLEAIKVHTLFVLCVLSLLPSVTLWHLYLPIWLVANYGNGVKPGINSSTKKRKWWVEAGEDDDDAEEDDHHSLI